MQCIMREVTLNKEEFKLFDQDDQFGFFYNEDGWPTENADEEFDSNVDALYEKYEYIAVDSQDNIYGLKKREERNRDEQCYGSL